MGVHSLPDSQAHSAAGAAHAVSASQELAQHGGHGVAKPEVFDGVSEAEVPSARWGWSMLHRRTVVTSGLVGTLAILSLLFGNHQGNVENYYLIGLAAVVLLGTLWVAFQPTLTQTQTVTARNRPHGHREPDWAEHQKQLTGVYANLSRAELAALNQGGAEPESH